jgi:glycosyltransferase involved in cell wall biosynthesis
VSFLRFFLEHGFSQLIVYSVPIQLGSWIRALGPSMVTWVTTKFELSAFKELKNRVSFSGSVVSQTEPKTKWRRSTAAISRESVKTFTPLPEPRNRLITINREEKIKTPEFLDAIVRILRAQPAATFAWTGCLRDVVIDEYFRREGVEDRCFFLGWVDPQCTLGRYDVFLDTYGLSGVVATQAFCGGMPTVFFRNSRAWVEMRESDLDGVNGLPRNRILAGSVDAYADNVLELINNPKIYLARVSAQRELAEKVFFNEASMYQSHIAIILSIVTESGGL